MIISVSIICASPLILNKVTLTKNMSVNNFVMIRELVIIQNMVRVPKMQLFYLLQ